ncbi:glycosyltransferase [Rhizobium lemnae]|uniref:Glycosyltransferase n=1 Tax=Rhizobium lemnae TaxID=1214924 RepID=A0ABV8E442_9HYPH|nr:glycosyltransferase [Rhizobium lemnae]MCJ8510354.1 glycosyltransferase [Rhizobium lemnae]
MLRILHVSTDYKAIGDNSGYGGVEKHVLALARLQREKGNEVHIVTTSQATDPLALPIFPEDLYKIAFNDPAYYMTKVDAVVAEITEIAKSYDIVHDHMGNFTTFAREVDVSSRVFLSCYAQPSHYAYRSLLQRCSISLSRFPREKKPLVVASSFAQRSALEAVLPADFVVHPAVGKCPDYSDRDGDIDVCIAGIRPDKCQVELARFAKKHHLPMLFAGPPLLYDQVSTSYYGEFIQCVDDHVDTRTATLEFLQEVVRRCAKRKEVIYIGEIFDQKALEAVFASARRVILLNSTNEVYSTVAMEALKRGIPCILGPYQSSWETSMGMATIVKDLSEVALAEAFSAKTLSRSLIRDFAELHFDAERWEAQWDILYRSQHAQNPLRSGRFL